MGLQNALHLAVANPDPKLVDFLITTNVDADEPDYDGATAFNLLSKAHPGSSYLGVNSSYHDLLFERLIKMDVRIDYPDKRDRTPFLNYYEGSYTSQAYQLLDLGANVN